MRKRWMTGWRRGAALVLACALTACGADGDDAAPLDAAPPLASAARAWTVRFLHRGAAAPAFAGDSVVLGAVAGAAGEAVLRFADGSPFAVFRVEPASLRGATVRGRPVRDGDTVRITLARADRSRFEVRLEPSGLLFNPAAPATLTFSYRHADRRAEQGGPAVWKQESPDAPWERVGGDDDAAHRAIRARLRGFTRYAVATGH